MLTLAAAVSSLFMGTIRAHGKGVYSRRGPIAAGNKEDSCPTLQDGLYNLYDTQLPQSEQVAPDVQSPAAKQIPGGKAKHIGVQSRTYGYVQQVREDNQEGEDHSILSHNSPRKSSLRLWHRSLRLLLSG